MAVKGLFKLFGQVETKGVQRRLPLSDCSKKRLAFISVCNSLILVVPFILVI